MKKCSVGGQAVMEGVMMKAPGGIAMAVRDAKGRIILDYKEYQTKAQKGTFYGLPIVRGVVAFLVLFGWGGLWLHQVGLPGFLAVFLAIPIGFAGMVGIALAVRQALRLQYDGTLDLRNALGRTGTVYLTVPPGRSSPGKVTLTVQEQLTEFEALTDSPAPIPTGSPVRVTGLAGRGALLVEPIPSESKETE